MKFTLRIPTKESYAYIEAHYEGEPEEAIGEYNRITKLITGGVGLDTRDFNRVLDKYLWGDGTMTPDEYEAMNLEQQSLIQTIKRSKKRNGN